jgi:hypothetical protein
MKTVLALFVVILLGSGWPGPADARVVRLVIEKTQPFAGGKAFGDVGPFERLDGVVYLEVDPRDLLNAVIVNLDKAPRNGKGLVEFSSPFVIIKPVDMARGNQKVWYGINNRGNPIEIDFHRFPSFSTTTGGDPLDPGDGLFFRLGFTVVDAGWAGDIVTTETRRGANLPIAVSPDGGPVVARIRIEYQGTGHTMPLKGNDRFRSYETADTSTSRSTLTVRDSVDGAKRPIPADRWAFGRCANGRASLVPGTLDICLFDGFDPNRIYELIYPAKNPWVMGLGYAVTRDLASFLRNATRDDAGRANPLAREANTVGIRRVYATGTSSTGMYLRDFLYLGFNEDEAHRKVFDGVRLAIPGTHRLFANVEFADPNVYSRQDQHHDFLSYSHPPLTYAVTTDPISGIKDGILKRPATDPFVIQVDSGNEFWQMNASLNVHDAKGQPVPVPDNVRLYLLASHSHTGASGVAAQPTEKGTCAIPTTGNRGSMAVALRALFVALDEWVDRGVAPPPSRYPSVKDGTLVTLEQAKKAFPAVPGVTFPTVLNDLTQLKYGPDFKTTGGRLAMLPPEHGPQYQVLVPKPDGEGFELGGIRTVDIAAPVGTSLSWNLRAPGPRGRDLCGLSGGFVPLAKTKNQRLASGDPRRSLEERYADHAGFVKAVTEAARGLVNERLLLEEDAQRIMQMATQSSILSDVAARRK